MKVQNIAGVYVAIQRDPRGGGYIARGTSFATAIVNLLATIEAHTK